MQSVGVLVASVALASASTCPMLDCSKIPPAKHVRDLKPCDIKATMAIGDSITAAAVPYPIFDGIFEYREISFSIGGGRGYETFPNILSAATGTSLVGPSLSYHRIEMRGEPHIYPEDHGSAAQSGAFAFDTVGGGGNQSAYLAQWALLNNVTDNDWKVLTIFIGANDICGACINDTPPSEFHSEIDRLLGTMRRMFKRIFINILPIFRVSQVYDIADKSRYCRALHSVVVECHCLYKYGPAGRLAMDRLTVSFNDITHALAKKWNGMGYDDFAVVAQPYLTNFVIPSLEWISPVDCFHPSPIAHADMAKGLWQQMFQPIGSKSMPTTPKIPMFCPNASSTFQS